MPVSPWPIVQPSAVTPPKPMRTPPTMWLATSSTEPKPSQRNVFDTSAYANDPASMPSTPAMPKVTMRDWSLQSISSSSVYATGETKLYDSARLRVGGDELLLERGGILGEVAQVAGDVPAADDHQAHHDAADDELGRGAELAVLEHVDTSSTAATTNGTQAERAAPSPRRRRWPGRSEVAAPRRRDVEAPRVEAASCARRRTGP